MSSSCQNFVQFSLFGVQHGQISDTSSCFNIAVILMASISVFHCAVTLIELDFDSDMISNDSIRT